MGNAGFCPSTVGPMISLSRLSLGIPLSVNCSVPEGHLPATLRHTLNPKP